MSESTPASPAPATGPPAPAAAPGVESPPPAPQPVRLENDEPRARLHELARELRGRLSRPLLIEYLRLRRSLM